MGERRLGVDIGKCGERVEGLSRAWLAHHRFAERTGIPVDHVRFCRERADVLGHLLGIVDRRYLFGPQADPIPDSVVPTPDWPAVLAAVASA